MKKTTSLATCLPFVLGLADCNCDPKIPEDPRQAQAETELGQYSTAVGEWVDKCLWLASVAAPDALSDGQVDAPLKVVGMDDMTCGFEVSDGIRKPPRCTSVVATAQGGDERVASDANRLNTRWRYIQDVQGNKVRTCACDFPMEGWADSGECWYAEEDAAQGAGKVLVTGESRGHVKFSVCSGDCGFSYGADVTGTGTFASKDSKTGEVKTSHDFELTKDKQGEEACSMDMVDRPRPLSVEKCKATVRRAVNGIKTVSDAIKRRFGAGFIRSEDHQ